MVLLDFHVDPVQQALYLRGHVRNISAVFFSDLQDDKTYAKVVLYDFLVFIVQDRDCWLYSIPHPMEIISHFR